MFCLIIFFLEEVLIFPFEDFFSYAISSNQMLQHSNTNTQSIYFTEYSRRTTIHSFKQQWAYVLSRFIPDSEIIYLSERVRFNVETLFTNKFRIVYWK